MMIRSIAGGVEVLAPAKLNLFLEVLARRPDGYHEIESLMVTVDLYDTLTVHRRSRRERSTFGATTRGCRPGLTTWSCRRRSDCRPHRERTEAPGST